MRAKPGKSGKTVSLAASEFADRIAAPLRPRIKLIRPIWAITLFHKLKRMLQTTTSAESVSLSNIARLKPFTKPATALLGSAVSE
jgi:hypothetical protein